MDIPALADLTPEQTAKAAEFLDILKGAQSAGKNWWAESQLRQIDLLVAANKEIARLRLALAAREPVDEPPATHPNGAPLFAPDGTMLDDKGNRSVFDDVDK